jgi:hypothetical protein
VPRILSLPATYRPGRVIRYRGAATDPEDGTVAKSSLHWSVEFHHAGQVESVNLGRAATGITGSFKTVKLSTASASDFYRVMITATDSKGASASVTADMRPQTVIVQLLATAPSLQLVADGVSSTAPTTTEWVLGTRHTIEAPTSQTVDGQNYLFARWSKGRGTAMDILVKKALTLTAAYSPA